MLNLRCGDCLDLMDEVPDQSIKLVVCDPPFGTTLIHWDQILDFDRLWAQYRRVLDPKGCVVLFGSQPFTSALVMSNPKWFKHELIWDKNKSGSPGLAKIRPMKVHENLEVFSPESDEDFYGHHENLAIFAPGRHTYNPQMEEGEPYARKSSRPEGYVGRCNTHQYGLKPRSEFTNNGTRYPKSIVRISRDFSAQQQVHPTQKPVPLLKWLIETYSHPGDSVLDNCMGSNATGIACQDLDRPYWGFEKDPGIFELAKSRVGM